MHTSPDRREPCGGERARSILAAADSVTVLWDGGRVQLQGAHCARADGDVVVRVPLRDALAQAALGDVQRSGLPVVLEVTDVAPVAVRARVRARLSLAGWACAAPSPGGGAALEDGALHLAVDVAEVVVEDGRGAWEVDTGLYRAAAPDCLAGTEAPQLLHLASHHADAVALLARLAGRRALQGAVRVVPVALDRYGLVLRVERVRGHVDVRLPFPAPLRAAADAGAQLRHLLLLATQRPACRPVTG